MFLHFFTHIAISVKTPHITYKSFKKYKTQNLLIVRNAVRNVVRNAVPNAVRNALLGLINLGESYRCRYRLFTWGSRTAFATDD